MCLSRGSPDRFRGSEGGQGEDVQYIRDVLVRLDSHPNSRINELLPEHWQPVDP